MGHLSFLPDYSVVLGVEPTYPAEVSVQTRYRETPIGATLTRDASGAVLCTLAEARIFSAGQSLVVYNGDECLGGGFITNKSVNSTQE